MNGFACGRTQKLLSCNQYVFVFTFLLTYNLYVQEHKENIIRSLCLFFDVDASAFAENYIRGYRRPAD